MMDLKHASKKRFAKSTTRKKTIQSGISAEYTEYRKKLVSVSTSVKSFIKEIGAARDVWLAVSKHQKDFSETVVASLPTDGPVRDHVREVEAAVRQMQRQIIEDEGSNAPYRRIIAVLEGYLKLIQGVENDYSAVETSYTEVLRYQKKVDKLAKSKSTQESVISRNTEKLSAARSEYDTKMREILARMHSCYDKHEAVFQCAHHAFWIAHNKYAETVNQATKSVRWESNAVGEYLVNIDVSKSAKLAPIARVRMLPPPAEAKEVLPPVIELPTSTADVSSVETPSPKKASGNVTPVQVPTAQMPHAIQVHAVPMTTQQVPQNVFTQSAPTPTYVYTTGIAPEATPAVVHLTPQKPSVSVTMPPSPLTNAVAYIPAVPTETPKLPESKPGEVGASASRTAIGA